MKTSPPPAAPTTPAPFSLKPPTPEVRTVLNAYTRPLTPFGTDAEVVKKRSSIGPMTRRPSVGRNSLGSLQHLDLVTTNASPVRRRDDNKLQAANILRDLGQQLRACGCTEGADLGEPYLGQRRLEASALLQGTSPKSDLSRRDLRVRQAKEGLTDLRQLNHRVAKAGRQAAAPVAVAGPREIAAQRKAAREDGRARAPRSNHARGQAEDEEEPSEEELSSSEREATRRPAELPIVGSPLDRKAVVERLLKRSTPSSVHHQALHSAQSPGGFAAETKKSGADHSPKPEVSAGQDVAFEAPRNWSSSASDAGETPLEALRGRQVHRYGSPNKQLSKERLQLTRAFVVHKDALGEVHRDSVVRALESYSGTAVHPELAHEAYEKVTTYNSLNLDEFIRFAALYEAHEEAALTALFAQLGAKGGRLPTAGIEKLLASCGVTPMSHVLQAILDEVRGKATKAAARAVLAELAAAELARGAAGAEKCRQQPSRQQVAPMQGEDDDAGKEDQDGVTFEEFKKLVELLKNREGFVKAEVERYMHMFDDYDTTGDMKLEPREIMGVLCHLGYALDFKGVMGIIDDVKGAAPEPGRRCSYSLADGDGPKLERREFLLFMRKAREREVAIVRELFAKNDVDDSKAISSDELNGLLGTLGYVPQAKTIEEAREDIGLGKAADRELLFHEVWQFLEVYRLHHGLSQSDYLEVEETYRKFDADGNGVLDASEVAKLLRFLGYAVSYHSCMRLMADVNTSHIDLDEFVELVRKYREKRTKAIFQALVDNEEALDGEAKELDADVARAVAARATVMSLPSMRHSLTGGAPPRTIQQAMTLLEEGRVVVKSSFGFDSKQVEELQAAFLHYDADNSGEISQGELHPLFNDLFPEMTTMAAGSAARRELTRLFTEVHANKNHGLNFSEFLQLLRRWLDYQDGVRFEMEQQAIEQTGFEQREVAEFRELFVGEEGSRNCLGYDELLDMLRRVVPLGDRNARKLAAIFEEMFYPRGSEHKADFSEFLLIMRRLLDINFAGISDLETSGHEGGSGRASVAF